MKTEIYGQINGPHECLHVILEKGDTMLNLDDFKNLLFYGTQFPDLK